MCRCLTHVTNQGGRPDCKVAKASLYIIGGIKSPCEGAFRDGDTVALTQAVPSPGQGRDSGHTPSRTTLSHLGSPKSLVDLGRNWGGNCGVLGVGPQSPHQGSHVSRRSRSAQAIRSGSDTLLVVASCDSHAQLGGRLARWNTAPGLSAMRNREVRIGQPAGTTKRTARRRTFRRAKAVENGNLAAPARCRAAPNA